MIVENLYKTRFFVISVQPLNLYEICQLFCNNCIKNYSFKELVNKSEGKAASNQNCPDCD
jgi:hypothetical protein